jgi:2-methylcitrate dehydratase PrpD
LRLKQKYNPPLEKITDIVCRTAEGPVHRLWEPLADKQKPVSSYGAKFSLPYSIAVMLIHGKAGLAEFTDEAIQDHAVLNLAAKVRYLLDPAIDYPRHFSGHVKIVMADGTLLEENQPHPRGGYEDPLPPEEIAEKFRANARLALTADGVEALLDSVRRLEQLESVKALSRMLSPD